MGYGEEENQPFVNLSYLKDAYFTACYLDPTDTNRGFCIMGPYTSSLQRNDQSLLYKPLSCISHLVSLLHSLVRDTTQIHQGQIGIHGMPLGLYVKKALDYIQAKYSEPITLTELAHDLKINRCYFCTLFKKETNKTFSQYLNEIRIERSKELLPENKLSILDIALAVGFNNQSYYTMTFKKLANQTPLEFRKISLML
ncbi:helix-turn-helix transcriptional regulator [Alkaliphilus metalliredigens]|nr:AraC family transcriptional regulator [Alkaliphilus metalliredigens]